MKAEKYKEIIESCAGCSPSDRPDIIKQVFKLKLDRLIHLLLEDHILGVQIASIYAIEFQKRDLPHAHILITIREQDQPITPDDVD
ncbi:MAG: hypothetical protein EZS28_006519 [Streblomastix strix]|uniref:Helitron helicase-like domain-containing protein n=1 Tax=Streblomastix strix TaxID=222440 RepID=A0A5J4WSQ9_9EUKA|nr:MAG: hypothetical protein EZS28_006519 [Streblomastix strix]